MILDSGNRRDFDSGAVRDIQEGKGRTDLLPLQEVAGLMDDVVIQCIAEALKSADLDYIFKAIRYFTIDTHTELETAILEVAVHFEEGAKKYGERNWEKGIPCHCYIDSGIRHYLKHKRGDNDERHDRAFIWNMLCFVWTARNKPELYDLPKAELKPFIPRELQGEAECQK